MITSQCFLEDFASNIELSEEQQIKLLQEYEEEIKNAKQTKKKPSASSPTKTGAIHKNKNHNDKKSSRNQSETKSNSSKRSINDTRSRSSDAISSMQHTMTKGKTHQSMGALAKKQKSGTEKKVPKQDIQSMIVEDHFIEEKVVKTEPKTVSLSEELKEKNISQAADNASSNSDESWEKDFEIENLNINAS